jgi:hypothetical protein
MNNFSYAKFISVCLIFLTSGSLSATNTNRSHSKLVMHGEGYENSCAPKEKLELMSDIQKNVKRDSRVLQTAIDLILCRSESHQNTKKVANFIDKVVTTTYEGTGEDKVVGMARIKMEVAKEIMAKGRAWSTTLQYNDDEVTLQYFSNEACVKSVKLRHSENSWLVYDIGGACD